MSLYCAYCGSASGPFEDDHVVPRSRGGPDSPKNLLKACKQCNRDKRDLLPSEWLDIVPPRVAEIEARVTSAIGSKIRGRRDWKKHNRKHREYPRCYFCSGTIRKLRDGFIEFGDQEVGPPYKAQTYVRFLPNDGRAERGSLAYPGTGDRKVKQGHWNGYERVVLVTHATCGPDVLYWLNFEQLLNDAPSLGEHLSHKRWGGGITCEGIRLGLQAANIIATEREAEIGRHKTIVSARRAEERREADRKLGAYPAFREFAHSFAPLAHSQTQAFHGPHHTSNPRGVPND